MPTEPHTWNDLKGPRALVCWKEINGEQGQATVYSVLLADGFLLDCGASTLGERRATVLAAMINASEPERLSRRALEEPRP